MDESSKRGRGPLPSLLTRLMVGAVFVVASASGLAADTFDAQLEGIGFLPSEVLFRLDSTWDYEDFRADCSDEQRPCEGVRVKGSKSAGHRLLLSTQQRTEILLSFDGPACALCDEPEGIDQVEAGLFFQTLARLPRGRLAQTSTDGRRRLEAQPTGATSAWQQSRLIVRRAKKASDPSVGLKLFVTSADQKKWSIALPERITEQLKSKGELSITPYWSANDKVVAVVIAPADHSWLEVAASRVSPIQVELLSGADPAQLDGLAALLAGGGFEVVKGKAQKARSAVEVFFAEGFLSEAKQAAQLVGAKEPQPLTWKSTAELVIATP